MTPSWRYRRMQMMAKRDSLPQWYDWMLLGASVALSLLAIGVSLVHWWS